MITGVITTDANGHSPIKFSTTMLSPFTNSYWFIRGICEQANVVTDNETWKRLAPTEEIPTDVSVFINSDPSVIIHKFPTSPIVILGNNICQKHLDIIDRLVHVCYRGSADTVSEYKFPLPKTRRNLLAATPHYQLFDYILKESEQYDFAAANTPFALTNNK